MSNLKAVKQKVPGEVPPLVLERAECDMTLDEQLAKARSKIDYSLTSTITQNEMFCFVTWMHKYGSFGRRLVTALNQPACTEFEVPECFALNVSPNSPVFSDPFPPDTMFNGLMAIPLPPTKHITLPFFGDSHILDRLCNELDSSGDLGEGDPSNFVGFFSSSERGTGMQFWCVVQCHSTALSRETMKLIRDAEPTSMDAVDECARRFIEAANEFKSRAHLVKNYEVSVNLEKSSSSSSGSGKSSVPNYVTWNQLFLKTPRMHEIRRQQREHRLATMKKALRIVGLDPGASLNLESPQLIESTFNCIDQVDRHEPLSDMVFLSRMSSIHAIGKAGTLFCEPPSVGVTLLRGPPEIERVMHRNAEQPLQAFIGVPVGTGVNKTPMLFREASSPTLDDNDSLMPNSVHCWKDTSRPNVLFDVRNLRTRARDSAWSMWLESCGISARAGETPLTPICVRWANPS
jgi:hypothetical protein